MKSPLRQRRRQATAAVEMALILPLFLTLVSGITDVGWMLTRHQHIVHAAREGVRYGASTPQEDGPLVEAQAWALETLERSGLDSSRADVVTSFTSEAPNEMIRVEVIYQHEHIVGLVPLPATIVATLTMRMEEQPE